jgi:hypothetical protein
MRRLGTKHKGGQTSLPHLPHIQRLLRDLVFYQRLEHCDEEIAIERRARGCSCGGPLHQAHFRRKPRGEPAGVGTMFGRRFSYCCGRCRARATPESLRYLGRKVYVAAVVLLLPASGHRLPPNVVATLRKAVGPSLRTLRRWLTWWTKTFTRMPFWKVARARLMPVLDEAALPASLVERFASGDDYADVEHALAFIGPVTTATG